MNRSRRRILDYRLKSCIWTRVSDRISDNVWGEVVNDVRRRVDSPADDRLWLKIEILVKPRVREEGDR